MNAIKQDFSVVDISKFSDLESWSDVFKYGAVGLMSFLASKYKAIFNYINKTFFSNSAKGMDAMSDAYSLVWDLEQEQINIDRVAVFRAGNGGSIPSPGRPMKVTMLFNSYDSPRRNQKAKYQELPVDRNYVLMLKTLFDTPENPIDLVVEEMEKNVLLTNIYKSEGITFSQIRYLTHTKNYLYYASYASTKNIKDYLQPKENNIITLTNNRIANLLLKNQLD